MEWGKGCGGVFRLEGYVKGWGCLRGKSEGDVCGWIDGDVRYEERRASLVHEEKGMSPAEKEVSY